MSGSRIFLFSCLSLIIGIFFGLVVQNIQLLFLGTLLLISFISCLAFRKLRWLVIFCLIFFIFGFLRADFSQRKIINNELQNFNNSEVVLQGTIVKEPEITQKNQKLVLKIEEVVMGPTHVAYMGRTHVKERVLIYASFYPKYEYGDKLRISGKLEEPPILDDFDYKQYLARKNIYSIMFSPEITLYSSAGGNGSGPLLSSPFTKGEDGWGIYKMILKWKSKMRFGLEQNFPSSQKFLLGAMLLGDKAGLTDEMKNTLNKAGIRHLTAISGMHVTIIVNLLMLLFLGLGLWRKQAFWLTTIFILFFVIMTGFQASTIRASIMGFLLLLGQHFGRLGDSVRAIVLGAALMLVFNPFLFSDAGFQLSFLAVLGINYLFPIFSRWFRKIPNVFQFKSILAMSLSAQIFTLPILIYSFGRISLVAPLTNILVLPLLPFIIVLGFLSALFGIFSHFLALIFVFPCWLLLSYLLKIAVLLSSFAFSSIHLKISWLWLVIFYFVLGYLIWQWKRDHRLKILGF